VNNLPARERSARPKDRPEELINGTRPEGVQMGCVTSKIVTVMDEHFVRSKSERGLAVVTAMPYFLRCLVWKIRIAPCGLVRAGVYAAVSTWLARLLSATIDA
jgi:hypothetical protein